MKPIVEMIANTLLVFLVGAILCSCAHREVRNRESDSRLTVFLVADNMPIEFFHSINQALVDDGRFYVYERGPGFAAAIKEQNLEWKDASDRFDMKTAYAHIGELHGVGGIIAPGGRCVTHHNFWLGSDSRNCIIMLTLYDARTAEVVASVQKEASGGLTEALPWEDLVSELGDKYPKYFEERKKSARLQSEEELNLIKYRIQNCDHTEEGSCDAALDALIEHSVDEVKKGL